MEGMHKHIFACAFRSWLPLACGLTILAGTFYVAIQQDMRIGANDPQIQMAEDAAAALARGATPQSLVPDMPRGAARTDISQSLAPFLVIYNANGQPVASTAKIGDELTGTTPVPPAGVFAYTASRGEDRLTWQPRPDVRIAAVVEAYPDSFGGDTAGFVLAGRSLREVERRESMLGLEVGLGWLLAMLGSFIISAGNEYGKEHHHGS